MTNSSFNAVQQTFALNWLSNILSSEKDTFNNLTCDVQKGVSEILANPKSKRLIGNWNVEWGPVVFSNKQSKNGGNEKVVADNTMFLVNNRANASDPYGDTFVLAIAGTNPNSPYGWIFEDFNTHTQVDWPFYVPSVETLTPKISTATSTGLNILLEMKYKGDTIVDKLQKISQTSSLEMQTSLSVTGHSLGGALSASLALALLNTQTKQFSGLGGWDVNKKMVVSCLPTAGASPGNADFATYYDKLLGSRTVRIWNKLDVVPHGWEKDMLIEAPHLYYPFIKPNSALLALVGAARVWSGDNDNDYQQIMAQVPGLDCSVNMALANLSTLGNLGDAVLAGKLTDMITFLIDKIGDKLKVPSGLSNIVIAALVKALVAKLQGNGLFDELFKLLPKKIQDAFDDIVKVLVPILLFLIQMAYQHVTAYTQWMGIDPFLNVISTTKKKFPLKC